MDEHAQGLVFRIITRLFTSLEYFFDNLGREHIWPALSVIATVLFILGVGYLMSYLVKMEEENIKRNENKDNLNNNGEWKNCDSFDLYKITALLNSKPCLDLNF